MRGGTTASVTLLDLAAEAAHAIGAQHSSGCPSLRPQAWMPQIRGLEGHPVRARATGDGSRLHGRSSSDWVVVPDPCTRITAVQVQQKARCTSNRPPSRSRWKPARASLWATALSATTRGLRAALRWYQVLIGGAKRMAKLAASIQAQAR